MIELMNPRSFAGRQLAGPQQSPVEDLQRPLAHLWSVKLVVADNPGSRLVVDLDLRQPGIADSLAA
jgi:hypothetical protein